jgi:TetR/AcrR family transcriptional repressor of nem operon
MSIGRPIQFDPDRALKSAMQLFWQKGYEATSLQDLLKVTGLSKSSLYKEFGNKHALFERSIELYRGDMVKNMEDMLSKADSGLEFIQQFFQEVAKETRGKNARRGCLVMNTATEFSQSDPVISRLVKRGTTSFRDTFESAILRAQAEGDIPETIDSKVLATYLMSSMSGLKTQIKAGASADEVKSITKIILSTLK